MTDIAELSAQECRTLLEADVVGRVAFTTPHGPRIVPINYVIHEDTIEFRTTSYSELATYAPGATVAFEIDHLDREHHRGWSIIVIGLCERVERSGSHAEPHEGGPEPWSGGHRPMLLRVSLSQVTGRRVGGDHWPHPVVPHV